MSALIRLVLPAFAALLLTGLAADQGTDRVRLPHDRQATQLFKAARKALRDQGWLQACDALQHLLQRPDCLIEVSGPEGGPPGMAPRLAGLHGEALRLLREMPADGQAFREAYWGPLAQERLEQARKERDLAALLAVARRFPTTQAAAEALEELARLEEQTGQAGRALLVLEHLKRMEPEAGWPAERRRLAVRLAARSGDSKAAKPGFWPLVGGDPTRAGHASGPGPRLEALWSKPLSLSARSARWFRDAGTVLERSGRPISVAGCPLVVENPRPGQPPLVVYRSRWGLQAIKSDSGDLVWRTASAWSLDAMLGKPEKAEAVEVWVTGYLETLQRPEVLFENTTFGSLSADSSRLYAVEDLTVVPTLEMAGRFLLDSDAGGEPRPIDAVRHNRLQAYDLGGGKRLWEVGGRAGLEGTTDALADSFFLGPPLPLDDRLLVLNEKNKEVRLLTLSPLDGKVLAVQPLLRTDKALLEEPSRRMQAAHPALAGGVLICPTNAGAVLGVDVLTGSLLWAHVYQDAGTKPVPAHSPWQNGPPRIVDGRVIVAPPDAAVIDCLDLHDGSRLWRVPRTPDDVALAGVADGKVLIVGKKACRALSLSKGETLWSVDTGLPSGQAALAAGRLFLPLRAGAAPGKPEVCVLDLARGKVEARLRSPTEKAPGTLVFGPGVVLSLTNTEITAYPATEPTK